MLFLQVHLQLLDRPAVRKGGGCVPAAELIAHALALAPDLVVHALSASAATSLRGKKQRRRRINNGPPTTRQCRQCSLQLVDGRTHSSTLKKRQACRRSPHQIINA